MTFTKQTQKPFEKTINSLFEDLFQQVPSRLSQEEFGWPLHSSRTPVNIRENDQAYTVELMAPGFQKSDFSISMEKNQLVISATKNGEPEQANDKIVRREFSLKAFTRSFTIDEKIDSSKITAKYENGILLVNLPRKEEVKITPQTIAIQ
jgi:HSP20 family protein